MPTSLVSTGVTFPDSTTQTTAYLGGAGKAANVQIFNSSGTWTKPSGYGANSRVLIQCWGGGGSGGSSSGSFGSGNPNGGGGGGGYNFVWVTLSAMGSTETATVGAGGSAVSGNAVGNQGGNTSLGSLITAYGGGGGGFATSNNQTTGGGGGGQIGAGYGGSGSGAAAQGRGGRPFLMAFPRQSETVNPVSVGNIGTPFQGDSGIACGSGYSRQPGVMDTFMHGGGGGSFLPLGCAGTMVSTGASSVWGGGGGGVYYGGAGRGYAGGTSTFGGNGGIGGASTGTAGSQPGGGGGGVIASGTSGAGGAGRIIVTVFDGA